MWAHARTCVIDTCISMCAHVSVVGVADPLSCVHVRRHMYVDVCGHMCARMRVRMCVHMRAGSACRPVYGRQSQRRRLSSCIANPQ